MGGRIKKFRFTLFIVTDGWIRSVIAEKAVGCNKLKLRELKFYALKTSIMG